ncbi:MAG: hypothetical protein KAR83_08605 [Thermodesulfovibrionales bacterium]|nr:hypothetical protein [Thermodesulfovibrionales bacterium]
MIKKTLVIMVIILLAFNGVAFAASGEVVMENTIYGGIIGGMLGGAWYLLDQDDAGKKLGTGVGVGLIAGFLLGLTDVGSFVEVEDGKMHAGVPALYVVETESKGTFYYTSLLGMKF